MDNKTRWFALFYSLSRYFNGLFSPYSCEDPVLQGQIQMKYDSKASKSSANTVVDFTSAKGIAHKNMAGFDFKNSVLLF